MVSKHNINVFCQLEVVSKIRSRYTNLSKKPRKMILRDWVSFFNDAGVQSTSARTYADAFVQNTIVGDMLADLNKEYLNDMGIKVVGDIIRILR